MHAIFISKNYMNDWGLQHFSDECKSEESRFSSQGFREVTLLHLESRYRQKKTQDSTTLLLPSDIALTMGVNLCSLLLCHIVRMRSTTATGACVVWNFSDWHDLSMSWAVLLPSRCVYNTFAVKTNLSPESVGQTPNCCGVQPFRIPIKVGASSKCQRLEASVEWIKNKNHC